jgi:hypothetical protein
MRVLLGMQTPVMGNRIDRTPDFISWIPEIDMQWFFAAGTGQTVFRAIEPPLNGAAFSQDTDSEGR